MGGVLTGAARLRRPARPSNARYDWTFARGDEEDEEEVDASGPLLGVDRSLVDAAAFDGIGLSHVREALVADDSAREDLVLGH